MLIMKMIIVTKILIKHDENIEKKLDKHLLDDDKLHFGGAADAKETVLAPASRAIRMILATGRATNDGVVYQQHILVSELQRDGIEFLPHRLLANLLSRHDERPPNVAIRDESFPKLHAQVIGNL